MNHIFISYSPKDQKMMTTLREVLLQAGFKPWIDPAPQPGMDWRFDIDDAIRAADVVLLVATPAAAESVYVTYEWSLALGMNIPVIPVIFKPATLHPRLTALMTFDMNAWKDERQFWDYFVRELKRLVVPLMTSTRPLPGYENQITEPPLAPSIAPTLDYNIGIMPQEPGHWVVIRRGPHLNTMFRLDKQVVTIGRDATNDISINDAEVSRYHMRLVRQGNIYAVEDTGSTNGTLVNGKRITGLTALNPGQSLMLGDTILLSYEVIA
jgi:hypothetical protein